MNAERTPWFRADTQKPRRCGLYEFKCPLSGNNKIVYRRFAQNNWASGVVWEDFTNLNGTCHYCKWRGLAKEPNNGN